LESAADLAGRAYKRKDAALVQGVPANETAAPQRVQSLLASFLHLLQEEPCPGVRLASCSHTCGFGSRDAALSEQSAPTRVTLLCNSDTPAVEGDTELLDARLPFASARTTRRVKRRSVDCK